MVQQSSSRTAALCGVLFALGLFAAAGDGGFSPARAVIASIALTLAIPFLCHLGRVLRASADRAGPWADVAVDSEFLTTMLERPLLPKHYLFFSFEGGSGTDGVVAISSQLDDGVQKQASRVFGVASTHTGILVNPEAAKMLNDVLLSNE